MLQSLSVILISVITFWQKLNQKKKKDNTKMDQNKISENSGIKWIKLLKNLVIICIMNSYQNIPSLSAKDTRYLNVGSWIAPSIWTNSYEGVIPLRLSNSCKMDTGVFNGVYDVSYKINLIKKKHL